MFAFFRSMPGFFTRSRGPSYSQSMPVRAFVEEKSVCAQAQERKLEKGRGDLREEKETINEGRNDARHVRLSIALWRCLAGALVLPQSASRGMLARFRTPPRVVRADTDPDTSAQSPLLTVAAAISVL